jgi:hypothetical protein
MSCPKKGVWHEGYLPYPVLLIRMLIMQIIYLFLIIVTIVNSRDEKRRFCVLILLRIAYTKKSSLRIVKLKLIKMKGRGKQNHVAPS